MELQINIQLYIELLFIEFPFIFYLFLILFFHRSLMLE